MPGKLLATQLTHVRLLSSVDAHVLVVVSTVIETFLAQFTLDLVPVDALEIRGGRQFKLGQVWLGLFT